MIEQLALDTNAVVDWLRAENAEPPPIWSAQGLILPLPVVGELFAGAFSSKQLEKNVAIVTNFISRHPILRPDADTALLYGRLRARLNMMTPRSAKLTDVWIAALCIQHSLPLLSNDRGFDVIPGLNVIHW